jgi:hypothetical protein
MTIATDSVMRTRVDTLDNVIVAIAVFDVGLHIRLDLNHVPPVVRSNSCGGAGLCTLVGSQLFGGPSSLCMESACVQHAHDAGGVLSGFWEVGVWYVVRNRNLIFAKHKGRSHSISPHVVGRCGNVAAYRYYWRAPRCPWLPFQVNLAADSAGTVRPSRGLGDFRHLAVNGSTVGDAFAASPNAFAVIEVIEQFDPRCICWLGCRFANLN